MDDSALGQTTHLAARMEQIPSRHTREAAPDRDRFCRRPSAVSTFVLWTPASGELAAGIRAGALAARTSLLAAVGVLGWVPSGTYWFHVWGRLGPSEAYAVFGAARGAVTGFAATKGRVTGFIDIDLEVGPRHIPPW
jgi:hypothetical protein